MINSISNNFISFKNGNNTIPQTNATENKPVIYLTSTPVIYGPAGASAGCFLKDAFEKNDIE